MIHPRRVVIKLGSQVVVENGEVASKRLTRLMQSIMVALSNKIEIVIVSSGAVGLGASVLGWNQNLSLAEKQVAAAVGQNRLISFYEGIFRPAGFHVGQILVTASDFSTRQKYLNLRETFEGLLKNRVVPIVNENDSVSTTELESRDRSNSFGDNDKLSALVAGKLKADWLIILSDVDGIYSSNPKDNAHAIRIDKISDFSQLTEIDLSGQSLLGRGGMKSKIEATRIASISGVTTLISSGKDDLILEKFFERVGTGDLKDLGTQVLPQTRLPGRKKWIGFSSGFEGVIIVNEGARQALTEKGASLLPVGIVEVRGQFNEFAVVSVRTEEDIEIGRGLISMSSEKLEKTLGLKSAALNQIDPKAKLEAIHRDDLVIFQEKKEMS